MPIIEFSHTLSLAFGYVSMACFSIVYLPAIHENYKRKYICGLHISFPLLWLIGDAFSVVGALLNELAYTVILIVCSNIPSLIPICIQALVYGFMDFILLSQFFVYKTINDFKVCETVIDENSSLLLPQSSDDSLTNDTDAQQDISFVSSARVSTRTMCMISITSGLLLLIFIAAAHYSLGSDIHSIGGKVANEISISESSTYPQPTQRQIAFACGVISVFLFMSARIPQIMQNHRRRNVVGLNLAMFCLAMTGNLCYILSILAESLDPDYITRSLPWLTGAFGVILLDFVILGQFYAFKLPAGSAKICIAEP